MLERASQTFVTRLTVDDIAGRGGYKPTELNAPDPLVAHPLPPDVARVVGLGLPLTALRSTP